MNSKTFRGLGLVAWALMVAGCQLPPQSERYPDADGSGSTTDVTAMETMTLQEALEDPAAPAPTGPPRPQLAAQNPPPIEDLPVPAGFRMKESLSRNYESATGRYVDHTYMGRADKFSIVRFYGSHMPANGWTLRSSEMVRGDFTITYQKEGEEAIVRVREHGDNIFKTGTAITVDLHPVGSGRFTPGQPGVE